MRGLIVLLSLLCCISLHHRQVSAGKVTSTVRHVNIPSLSPFDSQQYMVNGTHISVLCNGTIFDKPGSNFNCRVGIESAELSTSMSCNVTLRNVVYFITRVAILTPDKAILLWTSWKSPEYPYATRVINVLDFKDGCRLHETRLRLSKNMTFGSSSPYTPIVPYDDGTFDVFYSTGDICEAGRLCKVRFNDKAEMIGQEEPWVDRAWPSSIIGIYAVWPRVPTYGYLVVDYADEYSEISYVDAKGNYTPLRYYTWSRTPQHGESRPGHSINHNLLTICQNTPATCEQLDLANNNTVLIPPYIINPEVPITVPSDKLPTLATHTLRGGGFLYLQGTHLNRFGAKGQKAGAVEVEGLDCDKDTLLTNVFEKDDGRYCVSSMCYDGDGLFIHGNVRIGFVCFSDENFS